MNTDSTLSSTPVAELLHRKKIKAAPLRGAGADASARPLPWKARPAHAGPPRPDRCTSARLIRRALGAVRSRLPRRSIVPLPAAVSRSLPAVASHAIGYAEPRHAARTPEFGAYRGRREQSRGRPGPAE
jgi:hypothetical protein